MAYSVALIGLGGIGMLYDSKLPASEYIYSHARAFSMHADFVLAGAADPEFALREQFIERYHSPAYADVATLLGQGIPDVVVIASPTGTHLALVREVLQHGRPKLILCEKPLAYSSAEAHEIECLCRDRGIPLFANYIRRADPAVIEVKARLDSGRIASPFKAVVWYSKGLLHNGSHFVDLLTFWFGPARGWHVINAGRACGEHDAEPDFQLAFDDGTAIFCAATEENFSHYTVEIVASNGRLRYEKGGKVDWQEAASHPSLDNYRQLKSPGEAIRDDMGRYQYRVASQISNALRQEAHTLCDGRVAAANVELLNALLKAREYNQE
jgi:predicted dehydrogenase